MSGLYPDWPSEWKAARERFERFVSEPIRLWQLLAFILGAVALGLLIARSGNDPGVGVSDLELRFRALLDRVLGIRPRTKEFLVGHPALLIGLAMAVRPRWRGIALPLILLGTIGQSGMLNSFCHLHTPIKVTLLRTINGLWTGTLIGVVVTLVWLRFQQPAPTRKTSRRGT
jgi:hypothetical protein